MMREHLPYPVQNSTLSASALANDLCELYPLDTPVTCTFFRKGICDTYRVHSGAKEYYFKVYRYGRRTRNDVDEEVRLLLHLWRDGVSVAVPIERNDGSFTTTFSAPEGTRHAVLFSAAPGTPDDRGDTGRIVSLGKLVGRMHKSLDSFPLPYKRQTLDPAHLIDDNMTIISEFMRHRATDLAVIDSVASSVKKLPLFSTREAPEFGICHGDLHGGDVAYDSSGEPTLFDFDSSGCGWRAYEIGVFPASVEWMNTSEEIASTRAQRLTAFLVGYSSCRSLSSDELDVVRASPAIRHIFLMGHVLKFTTVTDGTHWADDGFIDWHMQWFKHWVSRCMT